uniref:hypothetical protein n=1 Tax=Marinobacterium profundum TaxID=1714300 RepID=UPI000832EDA6|nr:hypothetical protein [Marinobacterium profundum]
MGAIEDFFMSQRGLWEVLGEWSFYAAVGINLHVLVDDRDGFLTGDRLRGLVPFWKSASVWFCDPAGFRQALQRDLRAHGLNTDYFHQELFNIR